MEHMRLDCRGSEGLDQAESRTCVGRSTTREVEANGARSQPQCPAVVPCHGECGAGSSGSCFGTLLWRVSWQRNYFVISFVLLVSLSLIVCLYVCLLASPSLYRFALSPHPLSLPLPSPSLSPTPFILSYLHFMSHSYSSSSPLSLLSYHNHSCFSSLTETEMTTGARDRMMFICVSVAFTDGFTCLSTSPSRLWKYTGQRYIKF